MNAPLQRPAGADPAPILVVDDDAIARELVLRELQRLNLRNDVVEAVDGEDAVGVLAGGAMPALVLLDMEMPRRSGLEVLRWLRSQSRFADMPVVVLTGSADLDLVDAACALGISSYLVKPVGFAGLEQVVRQLNLPWQLLAG